MTNLTLLVSRHRGARTWLLAEAERRGWAPARLVGHLDPDVLAPRIRRVAGTLPLGLAGQLSARGIEIWHLDLTLDANSRGRELSEGEMQLHHARLRRVLALHLEE